MRRLKVRHEAGYSLAELMIVMAILGIVVTGLTTVFVSGSRAELDMNLRFKGQQNVRSALSQLRTDIHVGCNAAATSTSLLIYRLKVDGTCNNVATTVWCAGTSVNLSSRKNLWQDTTATCGSPPVGKLFADYLVSGVTLFTLNTPAGGSKQRMSVTVDLPVNTNSASSATTQVDRYELKDTIVLRNAPPA